MIYGNRLVVVTVLAVTLLLACSCSTTPPKSSQVELISHDDIEDWLSHMGIWNVIYLGDENYYEVKNSFIENFKPSFPKSNKENYDCEDIAVDAMVQAIRLHAGPENSAAFFRIRFSWINDLGHEANIVFAEDDWCYYIDYMLGVKLKMEDQLKNPNIKLNTVTVLR